ncbi:hypothetical protein [Desulfobacter vibrioformis]|uniref:hypothetical protein n=1 Tax=Desulfobacter vibrioformis TaxID=34031 RepID=UPI0012EB52CC|nr:hypothetical protein [Desulfobacter vibrioformis]
MNSTGSDENYRKMRWPGQKAVAAGVIAFGLCVGTGGAATPAYMKERGTKGYAFANYSPIITSSKLAGVRSPADNLDQIRSILHPAVTDLANALGVSRQAVYSWQAGKAIAPENAARLADLAQAADVFAKEGLIATAQILKRRISEGKNFFEIVRDGGSAQTAAYTLVEILRREDSQRNSLQTKLGNRPRLSRNSYDDLGTPVFNEKVDI